jgi:hypothetical protein
VTVDTLGRAFDLYRRTSTSRSAIALLIANAIPLVGVLFFGWSLMTILVLYWVENGIVGFWNVPRLLLAQGSLVPPEVTSRRLGDLAEAEAEAAAAGSVPGAEGDDVRARRVARASMQAMVGMAQMRLPAVGRAALAGFFVVHYGLFWVVHGIFVFSLPRFGGAFMAGGSCLDAPALSGFPFDPGMTDVQSCAGPFGEVLWGSVLLGGAALFISHGLSFLLNYVWGGEYRTASPSQEAFSVYGRVVVLHLTIIVGAFAVAILGAPIAALVVLVALKTAYDLRLHLRQHIGAIASPT